MDSYLGATANNVITNNTIASNAIGNSQLATSAINAIQSGLATSTQAGAIETNTQDIQNRLPTALVDGRMASVAQVVGDKTGYTATVSDKTGFSLTPTTGLGNQTADITGNLSGSVGSVTGAVGSVASFGTLVNDIATAVWNAATRTLTAFGFNVNLTPTTGLGSQNGSVATVNTVLELGQNALSANGAIHEIADIQVLSRLDSMIESDGAGQFRFDTIALENAPAGGGGGGGTDWNANERTAFRTILGFNSSGDILDPSSGILDTIRDSITGNQTINVYPVSASTPERVAGTTLTFYRDESRSVSVVTDFTLTSLTLQFTVEDQDGNDVYTLDNASINRSGQTFTIPITTAVTGGLGQYRWSMRDVTGGGNSVISRGVLAVEEAASNG
jgi:hypothetical protein